MRTLTFALTLAAVVSLSLSCQAMDSPVADSSGIEGQVLRTNTKPGPIRQGEPTEVPFSATFRVLDAGGEEVLTFTTDEDGRFKVVLPPGDYTIVPAENAPVLRPATQKKPVTVKEGAFTELRLVFDTGMR
jgi:hypothetical protein